MKIRKVLVICGVLISVTASTFNVSAATARAAKDCTGTITLAKTSGTFKVTSSGVDYESKLWYKTGKVTTSN